MSDEIKLPGIDPENTDDSKVVDPVKTTFGLSSFSLPTPKFAHAAFDLYLIITTAFLGWIVATKLFNPTNTQEIVYFITLFLTPVVKGVSKLFGVSVDTKSS